METINYYLEQEPSFTKSVVAFLMREDQVLLGRRIKVSNNLGQDLIAGIGGKLEDSESDEEALIRELEEEINVTPTKFVKVGNVKFLFPHKPSWQQDVSIFIVNNWRGDPIKTDVIEPKWFPINSIPYEQMWEDNSYWLPKILNGLEVDTIYLYDENGKVQEESGSQRNH